MERLVASKNNISELPADLWKMKGLELLDLTDNLHFGRTKSSQKQRLVDEKPKIWFLKSELQPKNLATFKNPNF